jgi:hypothetical protein
MGKLLVSQGLAQYKEMFHNKKTVVNNIMAIFNTNEEIVFDSNTYCVTESLSSINSSKQFTIIFDLHSDDWSKPFGYQLLGNYTTDGFGIFNTNQVTPTLFINSNSAIEITNLNFEHLDTLEMSSSATAIIRVDGFNDYYIINSAGFFERYNSGNSLLYRIYHQGLLNVYDYDYDNEFCYVLCYNSDIDNTQLLKIQLTTGNSVAIEPGQPGYNFYYYDVPLNTFLDAKTINHKNGSLYFTTGDKAERYLNTIYFRVVSGTNYGIYSWDITNNSTDSNAVSLVLSAYNSLEDYDVDIDGNLWALYDYSKYVRIDSNRLITLSGTLPLSSSRSTNIDFGYNLKSNSIQQFTLISTISEFNKNITYKIDNSGNLISTYFTKTQGINNTSITQSSYLRYYYDDLFFGNILNFKLKLTNFLNPTDIETLNINYPLSSLAQGYHNFAIRFNSDGGCFHLIIDGAIVLQKAFAPKKYTFSNLFYRPFVIGTAMYSNNTPIFQYLNDNSFNCRGLKLKNFYLYDEALNYFDILFHNRIYQKVEDITLDLPSGKRNYLEEIERYFKFKTPGSKSPIINIVLKNSGINNQDLRNEIEKRINRVLQNAAPAYIKVNQIKWSN